MFFAGLKDAVLWQRVLGVGNWEVKMQPKICRLALASLTSNIFSFDPRKCATWTCQSTSNPAASSWRGATWLANACFTHFCRAGLACAIRLRVVANSDRSRTGDFAAINFSCDLYIACCFFDSPGLHWLGSYRRGIMDASQLKIQDSRPADQFFTVWWP